MIKRLMILCILFAFLTQANADFKFRIWLKDKQGSAYSISKPEEFLTTRAIERRTKQKIVLDSTDLPVSATYLANLRAMGLKIVTTSRWMNTVVASFADSTIVSQLRTLPYIKNTEWVWQGLPANVSAKLRSEESTSDENSAKLQDEYGYGLPQLSVSNGQKLHTAGFKGENKIIALIDAGFQNADTIKAYRPNSILGTKDFVNPGGNVYKEDRHGQSVLSTMAAVDSFTFIGSAPNATYWLLRTEDAATEYPVEEDYWAAAAEFADSVGVDVINSSLGYTEFDNSTLNHKLTQLDGKTIFVSRAAQMAADKGMFVTVSAGNEGNKSWQKIGAPADAADILTVGAINVQQQIAPFSSMGFTADNRVKPDVVSVGSGTYVLDNAGNLITSSGTSFASPLMAGMVACLWQALPNLTNKELLSMIRLQSNFYLQPDIRYGYGVPDLWAAYQYATTIEKTQQDEPEIFFNNKRCSSITIRNLPSSDSIYTLRIYTETGKSIYTEIIDTKERIVNVHSLKKGFYIIYIESKDRRFVKKMIKQQ